MQQESVNKRIIRDFYRRAVAQGDLAFAEEIIADEYIQHSKAVKPGKAGLLEALAYMKQMPKPANPSKPFLRLIADGDYVVTNMCFTWGGKQKVVVDLFWFQNGKVAEHWDAMQDEPETTLNGNALMDGPLPNEETNLTVVNKERIGAFYEQVFIRHAIGTCSDFVAMDLIQHRSDIANGLYGLTNYLRQTPNWQSVERVLRIIGDGDFVVVQAEGYQEQNPMMFYDIFRLNGGKVVEQWGVQQPVG